MALAGRDVWQQNLPAAARVGAGGMWRGLWGVPPSAVTPLGPAPPAPGVRFCTRVASIWPVLSPKCPSAPVAAGCRPGLGNLSLPARMLSANIYLHSVKGLIY